jgi:ATP-dependent DNA ligase
MQRGELWASPPIGKKITVKYQELTKSGIPRFPVFIAVRDYE